jgi:2-keto-4-pentenoate hydratase/2-oxohepta-3-ene-1,7-dioic acid hydratase in catechol pathway
MHLSTVSLRRLGAGSTTAAVSDDGLSWALLDGIEDLSALLARSAWRDLVSSALSGGRELREDLEFHTPVPRPGKILCCGHNYRAHILEMGHELPEYPTLFAKFADTLTGPQSEITAQGEKVDWEAELAVVIGAELADADLEESRDGILGYTIANDISMRDWQRRTAHWLQGKAFDRTTPLGPVIVTADVLDPNRGLAIECRVNGEARQRSSTADLLFDPAFLVSYISRFARLRPGDLVLTGTPAGVGAAMNPQRFLADGDELVTAIEGIGELRNVIRIPPAKAGKTRRREQRA